MLDVDIVADDWRANPITSWTVRAHPTRQPLGHVRLAGGRYLLCTLAGETSVHSSPTAARNHVALALGAAPPRPN